MLAKGAGMTRRGSTLGPGPGGNIGAVMAINTLLKNPAMANPIPNPTAPKMTNLITLVALMVSCLQTWTLPATHH